MITNINPRKEDFEESIRALTYTCMAREIKPVKSRIVMNPTTAHKNKNNINNFNNLNNFSNVDYDMDNMSSISDICNFII